MNYSPFLRVTFAILRSRTSAIVESMTTIKKKGKELRRTVLVSLYLKASYVPGGDMCTPQMTSFNERLTFSLDLPFFPFCRSLLSVEASGADAEGSPGGNQQCFGK
uniref:Secreted protein n=1 Tax=Steinernema glaseri TaxID=37863 RepID=A0A1I7Y176_9BILA